MAGNAKIPVGLRNKVGRHTKLRELLTQDNILVAPGAFDCISGRIVQNAGFDALYLTGAGISMSLLGAPDLGMLRLGLKCLNPGDDGIIAVVETAIVPTGAKLETF